MSLNQNFVSVIFPVWEENGDIGIFLKWVGQCTYSALDLMFILV